MDAGGDSRDMDADGRPSPRPVDAGDSIGDSPAGDLPGDSRAAAPLLIAAAPNGAYKTRADHPALPLTAAELASTAGAVLDAGARMLHLHVRDAAGGHTLAADAYAAAIAAIRARVGGELFIQCTSEAGGVYGAAEQRRAVREIIDLRGVDGISLAVRELAGGDANARAAAPLFRRIRARGILAQYIVYAAADIARYADLRARGIIPAGNHALLLVAGKRGGGLTRNPCSPPPRHPRSPPPRHPRSPPPRHPRSPPPRHPRSLLSGGGDGDNGVGDGDRARLTERGRGGDGDGAGDGGAGGVDGDETAVGNLRRMVTAVPADTAWMACAFGNSEFDCLAAAAKLGGHVRIGFENTLQLRDGSPAADNRALIAQFTQFAAPPHRPLATPAQTRIALGGDS